MVKIIPSTKFRCLSVHKMKSLSCLRQFFYERVLNLQTKKLIFPFWFGSVLHIGWQYLLLGYDEMETLAAMGKESRRRCKGSIITADDKSEMELQFQIIQAMVFTGFSTRHTNWRPDKIDMEDSEQKVSWPIPGFPDVQFCSTIDMCNGTVRGTPSIVEIKSAKTVSDEYFTTLEFDAQPVSYILGHKKDRKNGANKCLYMVFRKTQKKLKRNQTVDEFIQEVSDDLVRIDAKRNGPEYYFQSKTLTIGNRAIQDAQDDIVAATEILTDRYHKLTVRGSLLDACEWPKQTKHCDYYNKPCPWKMVCRHGGDVTTFMSMFKQREMLYEQEKKELAT